MLFLDTLIGYFRSGPAVPLSGLTIQVHPPSMLMSVRLTGTLSEVSLSVISSLIVYTASPSLTLLRPTILPLRRMFSLAGAVDLAGFCCASRLSWCRGWLLTIVIWIPASNFFWSMAWTNTQESLFPQQQDLCPTKRIVSEDRPPGTSVRIASGVMGACGLDGVRLVASVVLGVLVWSVCKDRGLGLCFARSFRGLLYVVRT